MELAAETLVWAGQSALLASSRLVTRDADGNEEEQARCTRPCNLAAQLSVPQPLAVCRG